MAVESVVLSRDVLALVKRSGSAVEVHTDNGTQVRIKVQARPLAELLALYLTEGLRLREERHSIRDVCEHARQRLEWATFAQSRRRFGRCFRGAGS